RKVLEDAAALCLARGHFNIEVEHFLCKLLDIRSDFDPIARRFAIDRSRLSAELVRSLDKLKSGNTRAPAFSPSLIQAFTHAWVYGSIDRNASTIRTAFIVVGVLADDYLFKIVREASLELQKVNLDVLRRQMDEIVRDSLEE